MKINFIWNICFTTITTFIILILINKNKTAKRIIPIILFTLLTTFLLSVIRTNVIVVKLGKLIFLYEIICWILIIMSLIINKGLNKKLTINKTEKVLLIISVMIGIISLFKLSSSNIGYMYPQENNFYFNSDVNRSITQLTSSQEIIHKIHPLYRFVTLPLMIPILIINTALQGVLSNSIMQMVNGYITCVLQIICNSISSIIMYRILQKENLKENICKIATIIFMFSMPTIWMSILPETYAITTLMLLTFIYLYQKRSIACIGVAVLSIGLNFICIVPVGLICIIEFIKNFKTIKKYINIYHVILGIGIVSIAIVYLAPFLMKYIIEWIGLPNNIADTLLNSINYFLVPMLYGPNFIRNVVYFVQCTMFQCEVFVFLLMFLIILIVRIY